MKTTIVVDKFWSRITNSDVIPLIAPKFTYFNRASLFNVHIPAYKSFISNSGIFMTGLLNAVINTLNKLNIEVSINLKYTVPHIDTNGVDLSNLRDYQQNAIHTIIKHQNGIIMMPTGTGKTEIFLALSKIYNHNNLRVLILADSKDIVEQTCERGLKYNMSIGINHGNAKNLSTNIICSTMQSWKYLADQQFDVIIIDEAHHVKASTYINILKHFAPIFKFGFTATPFSNDVIENVTRVGCLGDVIFSMSFADAADYIATPVVVMLTNHNNESPNTNSFPYHVAYDIGIIDNEIRNNTIVNVANSFDKVVVVSSRIKHCRILYNMMKNRNYNVLYADGITEERMKIYSEFIKSDKCILVASPIIDEGVDLGQVNCIILCSCEKSPILTIQRIGRGTRLNKDKMVIVIDFYDKFDRRLQEHARSRIRSYKNYNISYHIL